MARLLPTETIKTTEPRRESVPIGQAATEAVHRGDPSSHRRCRGTWHPRHLQVCIVNNAGKHRIRDPWNRLGPQERHATLQRYCSWHSELTSWPPIVSKTTPVRSFAWPQTVTVRRTGRDLRHSASMGDVRSSRRPVSSLPTKSSRRIKILNNPRARMRLFAAARSISTEGTTRRATRGGGRQRA